MPVTLTLSSSESVVKGIIGDMSADGFSLRSSVPLRVGDRFTMHMARGEVACHVRWVAGLRCGGVFDEKVCEPS